MTVHPRSGASLPHTFQGYENRHRQWWTRELTKAYNARAHSLALRFSDAVLLAHSTVVKPNSRPDISNLLGPRRAPYSAVQGYLLSFYFAQNEPRTIG